MSGASASLAPNQSKRLHSWVVALADATDVDSRAMIYLGGVMGMRWSEIAGLRVGRLDLLARTLTVAETVAATGGFADVRTSSSRRTLPISPFLVEMLAEHLARRGLTRSDADQLVFVAHNSLEVTTLAANDTAGSRDRSTARPFTSRH